MGGVHGHINHLYEDEKLSFRDLQKIIESIGSGNIKAYEKVDGVNLYVTLDTHSDNIRIARNKKHIKMGGLEERGIQEEFSNKAELMSVLLEAYNVLKQAFDVVDPETKYSIFGSTGGVWISCDIIDPSISNMLQYSGKNIVFHKSGTRLFDLEGNPLSFNLKNNIDALNNSIPKMNESIANSAWILSGPIEINIRPLDTIDLQNFKNQIEQIAKLSKVSIGDNMHNFLYKRLRDEMQRYISIHHVIKDFIIKRELGVPNTPTINKICSGLDESTKSQIMMMAKDCSIVRKKLMLPIEKIVYDFSKKVLSGMKSSLVDDAATEIERLKSETSKCIDIIRQSSDQKGIDMLSSQIYKLNSLDEIDTAIEGIVFDYGNRTFKVTGIFAPINRICGYVKYKNNSIQEEDTKPSLASFITVG